jgi:hypothetical protein
VLDRIAYEPELMAQHRAGKKTAGLIGFAPLNRELAPWDDLDVKIFTLNELGKQSWVKRWDVHFQLHARANFFRLNNHNDANHPEWLKTDHGKPIYMQKVWPDIPNSTRYPIETYIDMFGRYATNTFGYMLGLAIIEGFERIELYGFEMKSDTEYAYQKPNAEYMIGQALGRGIEVWIDPRSSLLQDPLYGYQDMSIGYRTQLEMRKNTSKQKYEETRIDLLKVMGKYELASDLLADPNNANNAELKKLVQDIDNQQLQLSAQMNTWSGAQQEAENIIRLYDSYPFEQEAGDNVTQS